MPDSTIRDACPDDAAAYADCADMAALGHLADFLGWGARHTIMSLFRQPRNLSSYDCTRVALTDDGRIGGMLTGYTGQISRSLQKRTDWLFLRYGLLGLLRALPFQIRMGPITRETDRIPASAYYVALLAVYPHARRRGLSGRLLADAEARARHLACATLELDVDVRNAPAIAAYEVNGFSVSRTTPTVRLDGEDVAYHRMVKQLA